MASKSKNSMEQFYTAPEANKGIKFPLSDKEGKETKHWLVILGIDSDAYGVEEQKLQLMARKRQLTDDNEIAEATIEATRRLRASLVIDWSFPEDCTHENIVEFFKKAPKIAENVAIKAFSRSLVIKKKQTDTKST